MNSRDILALIFFIAVSQAAGIIGSIFTMSAVRGWYETLTRPELSPPNWVFGPVWTTLYVLMGVAAFLVWRHGWRKKKVRRALRIFGAQLVLNTTWSIVFFGFQSPGWAVLNIALLWIAILCTMCAFYKISKPAMWLLVPYILWVSFAGYLNIAIWLLN